MENFDRLTIGRPADERMCICSKVEPPATTEVRNEKENQKEADLSEVSEAGCRHVSDVLHMHHEVVEPPATTDPKVTGPWPDVEAVPIVGFGLMYQAADVNREIATERQQHAEQIAVYDRILREHNEFGGLFQPGGRFHEEADLMLGRSAVVEGGNWLIEQLDALRAENAALRDNNKQVKALFDEKAASLAAQQTEIERRLKAELELSRAAGTRSLNLRLGELLTWQRAEITRLTAERDELRGRIANALL